MELEQIIKLIQTISSSQLTEFSMEEETLKIKMKAERESLPAAAAKVGKETQTTKETVEKEEEGSFVTSPLVGTFYNAASPTAAPFVAVGDTVKKGQILGIVEAMKLMNEIECEFDGVIEEILVTNEQIVEYGQPLFRMK